MAEEFYIDSMRRRRMLPMSLGVSSPGGVLTQNVQPGAASQPVLPRSLQIRKEISDLESQSDDMSAIQAYGRQQGEAGQSAMLNALAAQFAGERFEPVQAQFLRRAAAAQQPMRVGRGMVTPDGQYIVDPGARRESQIARLSREAEFADRTEAAQAAQAERIAEQRRAQQAAIDARREADERDARLRMDLRAMSGGNASPYFQFLPTAQGYMAGNTRTGQAMPVLGPNGQPVIGAQFDPQLQGSLAGARTTATETAKQGAEAVAAGKTGDKLLTALTQAESILKSGPTGSGAGAVLDAAGRAVGVSRDAAVKAGQLETLSGWLVANVPRMEGPQSNFDVQVYTTMAGKVGDRTVPVRERLAALDELRKLQNKYKSLNQGASAGGSAPVGVDPKVWAVMTPEERALWK